jgi:hypothetical protein
MLASATGHEQLQARAGRVPLGAAHAVDWGRVALLPFRQKILLDQLRDTTRISEVGRVPERAELRQTLFLEQLVLTPAVRELLEAPGAGPVRGEVHRAIASFDQTAALVQRGAVRKVDLLHVRQVDALRQIAVSLALRRACPSFEVRGRRQPRSDAILIFCSGMADILDTVQLLEEFAERDDTLVIDGAAVCRLLTEPDGLELLRVLGGNRNQLAEDWLQWLERAQVARHRADSDDADDDAGGDIPFFRWEGFDSHDGTEEEAPDGLQPPPHFLLGLLGPVQPKHVRVTRREGDRVCCADQMARAAAREVEALERWPRRAHAGGRSVYQVPGPGDEVLDRPVSELQREVTQDLYTQRPKIIILQLHASLEASRALADFERLRQSAADADHPLWWLFHNSTLIVVSSALAESSITIARCHTVIDFGSQRDTTFQPRAGQSSLDQLWISWASGQFAFSALAFAVLPHDDGGVPAS